MESRDNLGKTCIRALPQRGTRTAILEASLAVLRRSQGSDFTLEEIATEAGISRQTLYQHFSGRAEVLIQVVDHVKEQLDFDALEAPVLAAARQRRLDGLQLHRERALPQRAADIDLQPLASGGVGVVIVARPPRPT